MDVFAYNQSHLLEDIAKLAEKIKSEKFKFSNVCGIPSGGNIPAVMLAQILNLPLTSTISSDTIVIDDIIASGATMERYLTKGLYCCSLVAKKKMDKCHCARIIPDQWVHFFWEGETHTHGFDLIRRSIQLIGDDPDREGLVETPKRVITSWGHLYSGYGKSHSEVFKEFDSESYDQIVLLRDFEFYSMCEHHMLPFFGKAHIAYIPKKKIIGVSKLVRLFEIYARRLQIQERICKQVTDALMEYLDPEAAACIIEAQHLCMLARGVEKQNSIMETLSLRGVFRTDLAARNELMGRIR